jgi:protease IV
MMRRFLFYLTVLTGFYLYGGITATARGQLHRATDPVATPSSSTIEQDDALAIDINPAAIGLLPAWSLAYLHSEVDYARSWLGNGDAVFAATPLFLGVAGGLSIQSIRPGDDARESLRGQVNRGMAELALAFAPTPQISVGWLGRVFRSGSERIDGLASTDLGLALRPANWLGLSLVGRDLLATREGFGTSGLDLGPSALLGTSVRPFGTRFMTVDVAVAVGERGRTGGRTGLSVAIPYFGALSAEAEIEGLGEADSFWRVFGGLSVNWGQLSAGGGLSGAQDSAGNFGWYALLRAEGTQRDGIPTKRCVLDLEIESGSPYDVVRWTLVLEQAIKEPSIAGVLIRPRSSGMSMADAQELRGLIKALRATGKRVFCHLESASGSEYYACTAADQIVMDPAGTLRLLGASMTSVLFGETLEKIGVRVEVLRIGQYKSAPEQFTQAQLSEPAREQYKKLLDTVYRRMLSDLAVDLKTSEKRIASIIDEGPYSAPQAVARKLVSETDDGFEMPTVVRKSMGGNFALKGNLPERTPKRWGVPRRLGFVLVDGDIVDGDNLDIPLLGIHLSGGRTVTEAIEAMAADPSIAAIVLRVDSPGGAAFAAEQIWRAVRRARKIKPVIASLGAVAASGGYYVACAADEIWIEPSTLTGSIGIFYGKLDVSKLANATGIGVEIFQKGRMAAGESIWKPYTPLERATLVEQIRGYYRLFLQRVSQGRKIPMERVHALGQGQVYSGEEALRNGLADRAGGLLKAIERARHLADLPADAEVVLLPERKLKLWDFFLRQKAADLKEGLAAESPWGGLKPPSELVRALSWAVTVYASEGMQPLALMPELVNF